MNWVHFLLWTSGIYVLYYLAVVLFDIALKGRAPALAASHELTFSETALPKKVEHLPDKAAPKPGPAIIGSGGVSLKNLFGLAREEAILYTKPVSF